MEVPKTVSCSRDFRPRKLKQLSASWLRSGALLNGSASVGRTIAAPGGAATRVPVEAPLRRENAHSPDRQANQCDQHQCDERGAGADSRVVPSERGGS